MGVQGLWKVLQAGGCAKVTEGTTSEGHSAIAEEVDGKVIAVDLSEWLMQATNQMALAGLMTREGVCLKVVSERAVNWLRYGCLPVFVLEGSTPPEKLERLRQRFAAANEGRQGGGYGNYAGSSFDRLGKLVAEMLRSMGLPVVQACGEGEATCAALEAAGHVDGVASSDVDTLLFGATTVYRTLHLQTAQPKSAQMVKCCMSDVQQALQLKAGGHAALVAMAQLLGGDYDTKGAEGVGGVLALRAVQMLLAGATDDSALLQRLAEELRRGADPALLALTKCTGCRRCKHESGNLGAVTKHSGRGCAQCATHACQLGGNGAGGCLPSDGPCQCDFHRRADERWLAKILERAARTPDFLNSCQAALNGYLRESQRAAAGVAAGVKTSCGRLVPGERFQWERRPDVDTFAAIMTRHRENFTREVARGKLLPVLIEWDVRQGPGALSTSELQLTAIKTKKVRPGKDGASMAAWRYLLVLKRNPDINTPDVAFDTAWLSGKRTAVGGQQGGLSSQRVSQGEDDEDGPEEGEEEPMGALTQAELAGSHDSIPRGPPVSTAEMRSARCSLVDRLWPRLVLEEAEGKPKKAAMLAKGRKEKGGKLKPLGEADTKGMQHTMSSFLRSSKATREGKAAPAKPASDNRSGFGLNGLPSQQPHSNNTKSISSDDPVAGSTHDHQSSIVAYDAVVASGRDQAGPGEEGDEGQAAQGLRMRLLSSTQASTSGLRTASTGRGAAGMPALGSQETASAGTPRRAGGSSRGSVGRKKTAPAPDQPSISTFFAAAAARRMQPQQHALSQRSAASSQQPPCINVVSDDDQDDQAATVLSAPSTATQPVMHVSSPAQHSTGVAAPGPAATARVSTFAAAMVSTLSTSWAEARPASRGTEGGTHENVSPRHITGTRRGLFQPPDDGATHTAGVACISDGGSRPLSCHSLPDAPTVPPQDTWVPRHSACDAAPNSPVMLTGGGEESPTKKMRTADAGPDYAVEAAVGSPAAVIQHGEAVTPHLYEEAASPAEAGAADARLEGHALGAAGCCDYEMPMHTTTSLLQRLASKPSIATCCTQVQHSFSLAATQDTPSTADDSIDAGRPRMTVGRGSTLSVAVPTSALSSGAALPVIDLVTPPPASLGVIRTRQHVEYKVAMPAADVVDLTE